MPFVPTVLKCTMWFFLVTETVFYLKGSTATECQKKMTKDGFYCVCDQQQCDTLPKIERLNDDGSALVFETSQDGAAFQSGALTFQNEAERTNDNVIQITIKPDQKFQKIIGFGGAFSDAAGINIASLSDNLQNQLLKAYFSDEGSEYSLARIPIASTDFSTYEYSYDDHEGDFNLTKFNLNKVDYQYKIPFMKEALRLTNEGGRQLRFFSTPWSSPYWMKTNNKMSGKGVLKSEPPGKYESSYAQYFIKFFKSYKEHGIDFWATLIQNEPTACDDPNIKFQCLGFNSSTESDFLGTFLGPAMKASEFKDVKIMIMEDQQFYIVDWVEASMNDPKSKPFVSGVSFHWYRKSDTVAQDLESVKKKYPELTLLASEACNGGALAGNKHPVVLGSWQRGADYAADIIEDLSHWTGGWVDWNLALNLEGGPNYVGNFVDSPIIVNAESQEFYKQPMYYVLAHFSKLAPPDSVRIGFELNPTKSSIRILVLQTPHNQTVVHALNTNETKVTLRIHKENGMNIQHSLPGHSLQSFVFQ